MSFHQRSDMEIISTRSGDYRLVGLELGNDDEYFKFLAFESE